MGVAERVHVFPVSGAPARLPLARFERLLSGDPAERLPKYAGERLRCALTYLELEGRKPVRILRTDFLILPLGPDGRLDCAEYDRGAALERRILAWEFPLSFGRPSAAGKVIDFAPRLARQQFEQEFTWAPTSDELSAIFDDIFG